MKLFVYGILKRNYDLDLRKYDAKFIGKAVLPGAILYGIRPLHEGPYVGGEGREDFSGVGLRFTGDLTKLAYGEVFEIPDHLWDWLDSIENNGFSYTRKEVQVCISEDLGYEGVAVNMVNAAVAVWVWVYEHTYPHMVYDSPIQSGVF